VNAIASGAARVEIEGVLESSGLRELFPVLVCLEDAQRGKPDPQGYLMARDELASHVGRPLPADRVLVFDRGRIVYDAPPDDAVAHYQRLMRA